MRILVMPGDGIGPEITDATIGVMKAVDQKHQLGLEYDMEDIGWASYDTHGTTLRDETIEKAKDYEGIMLGPVSHMDYPTDRDKSGVNPSAAFRVKLDLYANVRPARTRDFINPHNKNFDLVIMREATEGFYPDRNMYKGNGEYMPTPDVAISMRKLTRHCCNRIAQRAFELAMTRKKKVTAIHKANNFIISDGLFLEEVHKVAKDFPDVEVDEKIVDAMAAHLVRHPQNFDVIVATNFHADILSDLASELSGGLGLAGSVNASDTQCCAQAQHGSAPDIQGQNKANPTSLMLSAAMMLEWLGKKNNQQNFVEAGNAIEKTIDTVLENPDTRTPDLGGPLGTKEFGECVAKAVS